MKPSVPELSLVLDDDHFPPAQSSLRLPSNAPSYRPPYLYQRMTQSTQKVGGGGGGGAQLLPPPPNQQLQQQQQQQMVYQPMPVYQQQQQQQQQAPPPIQQAPPSTGQQHYRAGNLAPVVHLDVGSLPPIQQPLSANHQRLQGSASTTSTTTAAASSYQQYTDKRQSPQQQQQQQQYYNGQRMTRIKSESARRYNDYRQGGGGGASTSRPGYEQYPPAPQFSHQVAPAIVRQPSTATLPENYASKLPNPFEPHQQQQQQQQQHHQQQHQQLPQQLPQYTSYNQSHQTSYTNRNTGQPMPQTISNTYIAPQLNQNIALPSQIPQNTTLPSQTTPQNVTSAHQYQNQPLPNFKSQNKSFPAQLEFPVYANTPAPLPSQITHNASAPTQLYHRNQPSQSDHFAKRLPSNNTAAPMTHHNTAPMTHHNTAAAAMSHHNTAAAMSHRGAPMTHQHAGDDQRNIRVFPTTPTPPPPPSSSHEARKTQRQSPCYRSHGTPSRSSSPGTSEEEEDGEDETEISAILGQSTDSERAAPLPTTTTTAEKSPPDSGVQSADLTRTPRGVQGQSGGGGDDVYDRLKSQDIQLEELRSQLDHLMSVQLASPPPPQPPPPQQQLPPYHRAPVDASEMNFSRDNASMLSNDSRLFTNSLDTRLLNDYGHYAVYNR